MLRETPAWSRRESCAAFEAAPRGWHPEGSTRQLIMAAYAWPLHVGWASRGARC